MKVWLDQWNAFVHTYTMYVCIGGTVATRNDDHPNQKMLPQAALSAQVHNEKGNHKKGVTHIYNTH